MNLTRAALAIVVMTLAPPLGATVVYKSVSPSGAIEFSDQRPPGTSSLLEIRELAKPAMPLQAGAQMSAANMEIVQPTNDSRPQASARDEAQEERAAHDRTKTLGGRHTLLDLLRGRLTTVAR
jgi:hypothetical protein